MRKKIFKTIGIILLILIGVVLFNTVTYKSKQVQIETIAPVTINENCIQHLSDAVKIKTVSYDDATQFDSISFKRLISFLKKTYPLADSMLNKKLINNYSLLYKWEGKNPSLKPIVLMGHMDVVPAESSENAKWDFDPFSGEIANGFVCGRGTLDDKVNVIGILEAIEMLLKENFKPERTIYLAFGHDEEIGGQNGAKKIAEYLQSQNVNAEFVLDEGLVITKGIVPGIKPNVGLIGISEKGYLSVELSVEADGGHSSMPAKETPIGILSGAISKLEKKPMAATISEPVQHFLDYVGPEMPFFSKLAFANQWLLKSVIIGKYEASNSGNATVRTTTAPTIFKSGVKDNVLPSIATATINFRIVPGETSDDVIAHIEKTITDPRVKIKKIGHNNEATPVSDINSEGFKQIEKSIKQTFKNTLTAPALMVGATDEKHYLNVSSNLFRFLPAICESGDLKRIHGINEKISTDNFKDCVRFYRQLILNSCN
jgi:carboxypeptidase PM20D1